LTTRAAGRRFQRFVRALFGPLFQESASRRTTVDSDERRGAARRVNRDDGDDRDDEQVAARPRGARPALAGGPPLDATLSHRSSPWPRPRRRALFDALLAAPTGNLA